MEVLEVQSKATIRIEELYKKAFPRVARFVSKMGGSFEDAKDIFHDALVIYCEKTENEFFSADTSEEAYLLGIAKHLWIRRFNKQKREVPLDEIEARIQISTDYPADVNTHRLLAFLETAGKKCLELLLSFYFEKFSLTEIKKNFGFASMHSASVQKYKCIEKLRDTLHTKHISHESFFE